MNFKTTNQIYNRGILNTNKLNIYLFKYSQQILKITTEKIWIHIFGGEFWVALIESDHTPLTYKSSFTIF